jgi:hypothetical protein
MFFSLLYSPQEKNKLDGFSWPEGRTVIETRETLRRRPAFQSANPTGAAVGGAVNVVQIAGSSTGRGEPS